MCLYCRLVLISAPHPALTIQAGYVGEDGESFVVQALSGNDGIFISSISVLTCSIYSSKTLFKSEPELL